MGLVFSCIGDALLNINLFPHGMAAFAIAQAFYISAFGLYPLQPWIGVILYSFGILCKNTCSFFDFFLFYFFLI